MTAAPASRERPRRRRGTFVQEIRALLVGGLSWLAGVLPEGPLVRLAELAGSAWYRAAPERAAQARRNLRRVAQALADPNRAVGRGARRPAGAHRGHPPDGGGLGAAL